MQPDCQPSAFLSSPILAALFNAHLDIGVLLLQVSASASDCASCAYTGNENVDVATCLIPDLWPCGLVVDLQSEVRRRPVATNLGRKYRQQAEWEGDI